jgi:hypothetical protein
MELGFWIVAINVRSFVFLVTKAVVMEFPGRLKVGLSFSLSDGKPFALKDLNQLGDQRLVFVKIFRRSHNAVKVSLGKKRMGRRYVVGTLLLSKIF